MKRILIIAAAALAIISCSQNRQKKDIEFITDFYEHVLGNKPMTDDYLKSSVSKEILNSLWEADYDDTYSFWYFRTGCQDGPSDVSKVESIEPLEEGWYRVTYSDLGNPGVTDVKVEGGKITAYKFQDNSQNALTTAATAKAIDAYMREIGKNYTQAMYCIPYASIVATDESDPSDIKVWGDFRVENYNLEGEVLKCISGGSHPGLMHISKADDGTYSITAFDEVGDGSTFHPTAKGIFGDLYDLFLARLSDAEVKKADREAATAAFVASEGIPAKYYQDFGWDPVEIKGASGQPSGPVE